MRVLISNDDGIESAGIKALAAAFEGEEVWVVAPDREQSAMSHAITLNRPLRMVQLSEHHFAVDGTPTDAVYLGLNHVLKERRPDIVVSGVNHGANLGNEVLYSGTVAAAMEASLLGLPAIAVSLAARTFPQDFTAVSSFAVSLARQVLERRSSSPLLLNVNAPPGPIKGYRFTPLGRREYGNLVEEKVDPRGRKYYWIGGDELRHESIANSDCDSVLSEGLTSVTPLHLEMTHHPLLSEFRNWALEGYAKHAL